MVNRTAGRWVAVAVACLTFACGSDASGPPVPPGEPRLATVVSGLAFPLFLTSPPGDAARLFVVEKGGTIRIVKNGTLLPTPFLDLGGKVSGGGEQGLLGMAFHPRYAANGLFVVNYTNRQGDTRIAAYRVSADPDVADAASEQVLIAQPQPFSNHNGGMVAFGPDGALYIGLGDGGSGGDPQRNGQSLGTLLGKILRVEVGDAGQLSIPADNPFVGQAGARGEIWSFGLRNPWRFSFDRLNGDLYIGDVGQGNVEEVDFASATSGTGRGANYGWNIMEGSRCFDPATGCDQTGLTLPVAEYDHSQGCSITGGYVYRGNAVPALQGQYLFADFCQGWVRSMATNGTGQITERPGLAPGSSIVSFGEDAEGEVYILTNDGRVSRIVP